MECFEKPIMVTKSFLPPMEEYTEKIGEIWASAWLTNNGKFHNEFEKGLKKRLGVNEASLFVNGHLALETAIKTLKIKGEIITTPFTFASTTHAIINRGLEPVFCDIEEGTFNIDPEKIENLITEKTSAILPVHVFGNPCNVKKIQEIAKRYNLKVIYDAAHAFGVKVNDVGIGKFGDISMFSMHATKVFHSIEGGVLTYSNDKYKSEIELLKNFGISGPESVELTGINAKMNEFQAAMGIVNLNYIDEQIDKRKLITNKYRSLLSKIKGIKYLEDMEGVQHNYSYFPVLIDKEEYGLDRDELHEKLKEYNVFTRKYFYPLCTDFKCYRNYNDLYKLPVARYVADRVLTLPIYSDLELKDVEHICEIIMCAKV
ncbi:DegT/DnrJ/EryC1/StrS family aminotransferase [Aneurinibacillus uraniidurans]|uniref:DegT/DnrJ/EryC1/StrS family aminotransferase n=1 Tax=Aneurinibacillus uraniidurans TaxID=2966586 RepID=UPI00234A2BEC|nr:DegT/DnrJ/EryC1/StrS family aminotransferase [Aneurinibacillus sp. B1]WCN38156.1 DegT/DnrJ/EryC1/StrS family aminotransferase [Aneurinibacillus sp. B1]